jgi:hypothetical protein
MHITWFYWQALLILLSKDQQDNISTGLLQQVIDYYNTETSDVYEVE